jgi:hypothetical protein
MGMLLCRECRNKFSCRMGTSMEHSHVPLHKWLQAVDLAATCERYLSPQKLKRHLELGSYRTAWLMAQRIRDALSQGRRKNQRGDPSGGQAQCAADRTGIVDEIRRARFDAVLKALIAAPPKPRASPGTKKNGGAPPDCRRGWMDASPAAPIGAELPFPSLSHPAGTRRRAKPAGDRGDPPRLGSIQLSRQSGAMGPEERKGRHRGCEDQGRPQ